MTLQELQDALDYQRELYPQWLAFHDAVQALIDNKSDLDAPPIAGKAATSKLAALKLAPHVGSMRRKVLDRIRERTIVWPKSIGRGSTASEIVYDLESVAQTISARLSELRDGGHIKDSGLTRDNERGFAETVWILA